MKITAHNIVVNKREIMTFFRVMAIFLSVIRLCGNASAQDQFPHHTFRSVSSFLQIPGKTAYFTYQDKSGKMWFGTERGLICYTGFRKEIFRSKSSHAVRLIFEDPKEDIWFLSGKCELSRVRNGVVSSYPFNQKLSAYLKKSRDSVTGFVLDEQENLWCQIGSRGTIQIDQNGTIQRIKSGKDGGTLKKFQERYFALYPKSGTIHQTYGVFMEQGVRTRQLVFSFLKNKQPVPQKVGLKLETGNGMSILHINDCFLNVSKPDEVLCLKDVKHYSIIGNDLWIMTSTETIRFRDVKKHGLNHVRSEKYLAGIEVTSVSRDLEGAYWFSTKKKGIYYLPNDRIKNILLSQTTRENNIHYLLFDKRNRLIYGNTKGVFSLHNPKPIVLNFDFTYPGLARLDDVLYISKGLQPEYVNKKELLSVGFFSDAFNEGDTTLLMCSNFVWRINKQGKRTYLYRLYQDGKRPRHYIGYFETVCVWNGKVLVGNVKGMFQIENNHCHRKGIPKALRDVRISHMRSSKKLGLVIATRGKGIYCFKNNRIVKQITTKDGLIDDQVNKFFFEPNEQICWVATNSGISKLVFSDNYQVRIRNVTELDGLISNEVNHLLMHHDTVYASTKKGISVIPGNIDFLDNKLKKQVTVDRVEADGVVIPLKKNRVSIASGANRIVISLKSTHLRRMEKQLLRYRFDRNEEWTYTNSGVIVFYDLNHGEYHMELEYLDKSGVWQGPYALFTLLKEPGYTETIWFDMLLVLLSFSVGFLLIRRRVMQVNKRREFKHQIQVMEQKALLAQMNPHFVFSALNSIQDFLVRDENELAERYLTRLSQLIRMILVNSREGIVSIEKEIDLLKKYLELERIRFKNRFDTEFKVSIDLENQGKLIPPMLVQPFIECILIHSFEGLSGDGKIKVSYSIPESGILIVEIEHNGTWYDYSEHSDSAAIATERLQLFTEKYHSLFQHTIQKQSDASGVYTGVKLELRIPIIERESI